MAYFITALYMSCLTIVLIFSLGQLHLTYLYSRRRPKGPFTPTPPNPLPNDEALWPIVTIQLPIYNEKYVAERLLKAVAQIQYPADKLEIQVLDDSTDETVELVANEVARLREQGVWIEQVRRPVRKGYKAGALQYGLAHAKGEFVAIFDADFLPEPSFLIDTLPYFGEKVGVVQTRWGHLNKNFSMLTRVQAFFLDAHFTVEHGGRKAAGSFINFNGTAGIWRRSCIDAAGGWHDDTLSEDLDLSYRAQLKGWNIHYLENIVSPGELPAFISAVKSQQFRWNKGGAESARKHLFTILKSDLKPINKLHAALHLLNSSVSLFIFISALLSIPLLILKDTQPSLGGIIQYGTVFVLGFASIGWFYWVAAKRIEPDKTLRYYVTLFPSFIIFSMGLSLHNAIAVLEGLLGFKSPFIRTPKFNLSDTTGKVTKNAYLKASLSWQEIIEGLLAIYFGGGVALGFLLEDFGLIFFHAMLSIGFASVFYQSMKTT